MFAFWKNLNWKVFLYKQLKINGSTLYSLINRQEILSHIHCPEPSHHGNINAIKHQQKKSKYSI
jgi:hypothetical protein